MSEELWRLQDVRMGGRRIARLEGVTLCILRGVTAVMGPSGAGKTSLLNLLVGFEKPDAGQVLHLSAGDEFPLPLFWVPQDGGLWPHVTVREHLQAVAPQSVSQDELGGLLRAFDMEDKASSYPGELSMGERARLAVARALASRAAVLVMDEPLMHVDPARAPRYWEAVRGHVRSTGTSLVFATHSPAVVLAEAQRVVCLKEGRLIYEGNVDKLYWTPASREQAECLGEVNWLTPEEARLWLSGPQDGRLCYRPEHISLTRVPDTSGDGVLVVEDCAFKGPVSEVKLRHTRTGEVRLFCCLSGAAGAKTGASPPEGSSRCRPGDRVILRALLVLLLTVVLGCERSEAPPLKVRQERHWAMPPDENRIPAPRSVAIGDGGEVFVIDTAGRVLVADTSGAARASGQLPVKRSWRMPDRDKGTAEGICVLSDGRVAVADTHYSRIVVFDREGKLVRTFGQYGERNGEFIYPVGIVRDGKDDLYVCEYGGNDRVQKFTAEGKFLGAFGAFGTGAAQFQRPSGMALARSAGAAASDARTGHEDRLYVADAINNRVLAFRAGGEFVALLGGAERPLAFKFPYGVALGSDESLFVIEYGAGRLTKVGLDGRMLGRFGSTGDGEGQFRTPWGLAVDAGGKRVLVADTGNRRIVELEL